MFGVEFLATANDESRVEVTVECERNECKGDKSLTDRKKHIYRLSV